MDETFIEDYEYPWDWENFTGENCLYPDKET